MTSQMAETQDRIFEVNPINANIITCITCSRALVLTDPSQTPTALEHLTNESHRGHNLLTTNVQVFEAMEIDMLYANDGIYYYPLPL